MRTRTTLATLITLAACGDSGGGTNPPDAPPPVYSTMIEFPVTPNRNLDLLFVVDDSPSMMDKQSNVASNFVDLAFQLEYAPGGRPNIHLGVVSTDMGAKGSAVATPGPTIGSIGQGGCGDAGKDGLLLTNGADIGGNFISDVEGPNLERIQNFMPPFTAAALPMLRLGGSGCGFEQPLHAMRRAFENPANTGFVRDEALLAVVFLTDEDDCSLKTPELLGPESAALGAQQSFRCTRFGVTCATDGASADAMNQVGTKEECTATTNSPYLDDIAPYRDFLVNLKGDANKVVVATIMAPSTPFVVENRPPPNGGASLPALAHSCQYDGMYGLEVGDPPVRLDDFASRFSNRRVNVSICQDLGPGLEQIGDLLLQSLGSSCLGTTTIPEGADCYVEDVVGTTVTRIDTFQIVTDPDTCYSVGGKQKLVVTRAGAVDPATRTRLRCAL